MRSVLASVAAHAALASAAWRLSIMAPAPRADCVSLEIVRVEAPAPVAALAASGVAAQGEGTMPLPRPVHHRHRVVAVAPEPEPEPEPDLIPVPAAPLPPPTPPPLPPPSAPVFVDDGFVRLAALVVSWEHNDRVRACLERSLGSGARLDALRRGDHAAALAEARRLHDGATSFDALYRRAHHCLDD